MLYYKNDIRYRPFLSFTTLRIVGLIIFGITQLLMAFYILLYTSVIPMDSLNSDNVNNIFDLFLALFAGDDVSSTVNDYKTLISVWPAIKIVYNVSRLVPPLLIAGLFGRLIQNPAKIKIIFLRYLFMTIILFIAELFFYYSFFDAMLEEIKTTNNLDETIVELSRTFVKAFMRSYSNLNIFLDMVIAIIFFKFYMAIPKSNFFKKHFKAYRRLAIIPVIYIIISTFIIGFEKLGYISMPIVFNSLLSSRGIFVYILFFSMCLYFKYRFKTERRTARYIDIVRTSNLELYNFNICLCLLLLILTLISRLMAFSDTLVAFRLDYATGYYYLVPLILFYNYTIRPRFKLLHVLYGLYYFVLFIILGSVYIYVLEYIVRIITIISNTM